MGQRERLFNLEVLAKLKTSIRFQEKIGLILRHTLAMMYSTVI